MEKDKIKGAVRTDFILSAEIIAITLGTVASAPFGQQVAVLAGIALIMTVGDRKSTRLNSSHGYISDAGFCFEKKKREPTTYSLVVTDIVDGSCSVITS